MNIFPRFTLLVVMTKGRKKRNNIPGIPASFNLDTEIDSQSFNKKAGLIFESLLYSRKDIFFLFRTILGSLKGLQALVPEQFVLATGRIFRHRVLVGKIF